MKQKKFFIHVSENGNITTTNKDKHFIENIEATLSSDGTELTVGNLFRPVHLQFEGGDMHFCNFMQAGTPLSDIQWKNKYDYFRFTEIFINALSNDIRNFETMDTVKKRAISLINKIDTLVELGEIPSGYAEQAPDEVITIEEEYAITKLIRVVTIQEITEDSIYGGVYWAYNLDRNQDYINYLKYTPLDAEAPTTGNHVTFYDYNNVRISLDIYKDTNEMLFIKNPTNDDFYRYPSTDAPFTVIEERKVYFSSVLYTPKTRNGKDLKEPTPLVTTDIPTGQYWVVNLYGKEYTTAIYRDNNDREWWYEPFSGEKYKPEGNGRLYNEDTDSQYEAENDIALHPNIIVNAPISLLTQKQNVTHYRYSPKIRSTILPLKNKADYPSVHGVGVIGKFSFFIDFTNPDLTMLYVEDNYEYIPIQKHDIVRLSKLYGVTKLVIPNKLNLYSNLVYEQGRLNYTYCDSTTIGFTTALVSSQKTNDDIFTLDIPKISDNEGYELVDTMAVYHQFPTNTHILTDRTAISAYHRLQLYLNSSTITEIIPKDMTELELQGEFWVYDDIIYATGRVRQQCPLPEDDIRFENLYDPLEYLIPTEEPNEEEIERIINLIKDDTINKINPRKVFPRERIRGIIRYGQPSDWVVSFINRLLTACDEQDLIVNYLCVPSGAKRVADEHSLEELINEYPFAKNEETEENYDTENTLENPNGDSYVEYSPTLLDNGNIEVSYTVFSADGSIEDADVKSITFGDCIMIDEEV